MFAKRITALLLSGTALVAWAGVAQAQSAASQTTAGTVVNNTASITYSVNGDSHTTNSTTASFVVDRKVNFTVVTDQTGFTQVNLNQQNVVTRFKVTNLTNGAQDFLLDPDQQTIGLGLLPGTDDFDVTGLKAYVDANGDGVYDPAVDTATWIDELAPDQSATVFIVGNVPASAGATYAFNSLHVIAAAGGASTTKGGALIATDLSLGNADGTVDIVFADDDSDGAGYLGDLARNGQGRAYSGWQVGTRNVALSVAKSARILSDPVNQQANPKALPGAVIEYCLRVTNATVLTGADAVTLTDAVPANTTYVPGSISIGSAGVLGIACVVAGSTEDDDANDAGEGDGVTGAFDTATKVVTMTIDRVGGASTVAAAFRVTID